MAEKTKKKGRKRPAIAGRRRKLAIVMSGGGMRCAYGAGALLAIAEQYKIAEPDILIAASGSAGNSAYYLSEQWDSAANIWIQGVTSPKFISFRRRRILDVDYLIDEVFRKQHPFDIEKIKSKKTKWLLPVTRVRDGATVYLVPKRTEEVYEYLRAAKAIPIVYGKTVTIDGEEYIDGDFGSDTEDLERKALALGAKDIIVIENSPPEFFRKTKRINMNAIRIVEKLRRDAGMLRAVERELVEKAPVIAPKGYDIIRIAPSKNLHIATSEKSKLKVRTAFNLGYADARDNKELQKLLQKK
jgi:predicted patatin/cPLA2 family phospholipase